MTLEKLFKTYGKEKNTQATPAQIDKVIHPERQSFETLVEEYSPDIQIKAQKVEGLRRRHYSRKQR